VVGADSSLANEINYLKTQYKFNKRCTILPEALVTANPAWGFRSLNEHKLDRYFRQIFETGIYSIAKENERYKNMLKRINGSRLIIDENTLSSIYSRVETVKLSGSIQTIFELWIVLIFVAVIGLTIEVSVNKFASFNIEVVMDSLKVFVNASHKLMNCFRKHLTQKFYEANLYARILHRRVCI